MATQVALAAASLNSDDAFVLVGPQTVYVWAGRGCVAEETAVATTVADILALEYQGCGGRAVVAVAEGDEPEAFWALLGGRAAYAQAAPGEQLPKPARLFQASGAAGSFKVEEVHDFDQSDLADDDVFLMDIFTQLFVWVGALAPEEDRKQAFELAERFVQEANDGRSRRVPIVKVRVRQRARCVPHMSVFPTHAAGCHPGVVRRRASVFHRTVPDVGRQMGGAEPVQRRVPSATGKTGRGQGTPTFPWETTQSYLFPWSTRHLGVLLVQVAAAPASFASLKPAAAAPASSSSSSSSNKDSPSTAKPPPAFAQVALKSALGSRSPDASAVPPSPPTTQTPPAFAQIALKSSSRVPDAAADPPKHTTSPGIAVPLKPVTPPVAAAAPSSSCPLSSSPLSACLPPVLPLCRR